MFKNYNFEVGKLYYIGFNGGLERQIYFISIEKMGLNETVIKGKSKCETVEYLIKLSDVSFIGKVLL